jgi:hypothetical protein
MAESGEHAECVAAGRRAADRFVAADPFQAAWRKSSWSNYNGNCVEVAWRKSSWSTYNGNCVEVAWRKSSWSSYNGNCVEVAELGGRLIGVRDTKDTSMGPVLVLGRAAWRAFVDGVKNDGWSSWPTRSALSVIG